MYNKTIIRFGFCDIQNNQGLGMIRFKVGLKLRLGDLNCNFECEWLIELSNSKLFDNKLSNNKLSDTYLASELVENRSFLNQSQSRKW